MIKKEDFLIDDFLFFKNGFGMAPGLGNMGHLIIPNYLQLVCLKI